MMYYVKVTERTLSDGKVYGVALYDGENIMMFSAESMREAYTLYHKLAGAIEEHSLEKVKKL